MVERDVRIPDPGKGGYGSETEPGTDKVPTGRTLVLLPVRTSGSPGPRPEGPSRVSGPGTPGS